jgi:hypothetical protein
MSAGIPERLFGLFLGNYQVWKICSRETPPKKHETRDISGEVLRRCDRVTILDAVEALQ